MKNKLLRGVCLVMASAMGIGALGGCTGKQVGTDNTEQVVRVWSNDAHSKDLITRMVADYNNTIGKQDGIRIEYTVHGGDYWQVLDMALETDQAPELFKVANNVRYMVMKDQLLPIEELPNGPEFLKKYEGDLVEERNIVDGKTYHVPFMATTLGLIYNKDMFREAGIVDENGEALPPKSLAEVRETAKKLTDPAKKVYGIALPMKWDEFYTWDVTTPLSNSIPCGSEFDFQNGRYDYSVFKPGFEWLLGIKEDASFLPGAEGLDNDAARAQFSSGRIGMFLAASWDVGVFNEQFVADFDWGVAPSPVVNTEHVYKQASIVGPLLGISKKAKEQDLAKIEKVYEWFNSPEFISKMYQEGKYIPYDSEIIENTPLEKPQKGWKEFADIVKISYIEPAKPSLKIEGEETMQVYGKIWCGEYTIDKGLQILTDQSNTALDKAVANGQIKLELFTNPDYIH